jgi:thiopeptide-type bacteriocin biosynthesis protein
MKENKLEWISCYIFHNISFEKVLVNLVEPLITFLNDKVLIDEFFYIRYWEKGPHIRLRVLPKRINCKNKIEKLIKSNIENYFNQLQSDIEFKLEFNNYIHEIQRYGGAATIKITQNHFHDSSKLVLKILKKKIIKWDYSSAISYAIQINLLFIKEIIKDRKDVILYFKLLTKTMFINSVKLDANNLVTKKESEKSLRFFTNSYMNQKKNIDLLVKIIWEEGELDFWMKDWFLACKKFNLLTKDVGSLEPEWFEFNKNLKLSIEKQALWSILDSHIHMNNNRLGIHLRDEAFIAFLIFKGLKSLVKE